MIYGEIIVSIDASFFFRIHHCLPLQSQQTNAPDHLEVSVQVPETVSSEYDWEIVPHDNFTDQKNTAGWRSVFDDSTAVYMFLTVLKVNCITEKRGRV
jgi:hypothetical protein